MGGYGRSWRNLQRELAPGAPTVAALNGWRRFARPLGLAAIAAVAGAAVAIFIGSNGGDAPKTRSAPPNMLASAESRSVQISVTQHGCATNAPRYPSGQLLFTVNNKNATGLGTIALLQDGMRIREREGVVPGTSGSFTANVQPGHYVIACPGTTLGQTALDVVGPHVAGSGPDTIMLLQAAGRSYNAYVSNQANQFVSHLNMLISYAQNNRPVLAECAYARTRRALDYFADAPGVDALGSERLGDGLKRVGRPLFQQHTTVGVAAEARKLLPLARSVQKNAPQLPFDSVNVSRAALEQVTDIAQSAIVGQSEPYSHGDLADIYAMVQGSRAATNTLRAALTGIDGTFMAGIDNAYNAFDKLIMKYHNGSETTGGFVAYDKLGDAAKKQIAQALLAIEVPVSRIPAKLVRQ